jgi:hypothetical protein
VHSFAYIDALSRKFSAPPIVLCWLLCWRQQQQQLRVHLRLLTAYACGFAVGIAVGISSMERGAGCTREERLDTCKLDTKSGRH